MPFAPVDAALNELVESVIGAAIEVHRELGAGFAEATYQRALAVELGLRGIRFAEQVPVALTYKSQAIGHGRIDMLIDGRLIVELKAADANPQLFQRQVVAYLKATGHRLGLIINFEVEVLKTGIQRVILG